MREEKIYKDNSITKDKIADLLGTNRTYLSRIINEQSKQSFTRYVNSSVLKKPSAYYPIPKTTLR